MPSGHSGSRSHSGGHFSGGRSHSSSHSGGHFGGISFGGSRGSSRPSMRWRPHTTIIFGRPVYLGAGRVRAVSALGILIVVAMIISVLLGLGWYATEDDLSLIRGNYKKYQAMAETAAEDARYQLWVSVNAIEQYNDTGKYCIFYDFNDGHSFYVYTYAEAKDLLENGVVLALGNKNTQITRATDSVPLDYKDTVLSDDAEYLDYLETRNVMRVITLGMIGLTIAAVVAAVVVPMTAQKATPEQIAASKGEGNPAGDGTNANNQDSTSTGTWRCAYCNTLNDISKNGCDGCGAKRQK